MIRRDSRYRDFWAQSLGVRPEVFDEPGLTLSGSGHYLERSLAQDPQHPLCFYFELSETGKGVFCARPATLDRVRAELWEAGAPATSLGVLRSLPGFAGTEFEHRDIDLYLPSPPAFRPGPRAARVREIYADTQLGDFGAVLGDDALDTLDLAFSPGERAFALSAGGGVAAVARSLRIPRMPGFADITVAVRPSQRGRGFGTTLVSRVVSEALAAGLLPKYRVEDDNLASLAIARRLGFVEVNRLWAWREAD